MVALKNAFSSMKSNKLKVFVAMFWIIVGITAVVVISSVGKGLENEMDKIIQKAENNKITIEFIPKDYNVAQVGLVYQPFSSKEMDIIALTKGVQGATTNFDDDTMQDMWYTSIEKDGTYESAILVPYDLEKRPDILYGRDFALDELDRNAILLSEMTSYLFYDSPEEALGKPITIDSKTYEVVGIVPPFEVEGFMGNGYAEPYSYIPQTIFDSMMDSFSWDYGSARIQLLVSKGFDKYEVAQSVIESLNSTRTDGEYMQGYEEDPTQELRYMKGAIAGATILITLVSLAMGGLGIMNIMYMAVVERKREIGIRRAIGAKARHIVFQFVAEAAVITTLGGLIGLVVGIIASLYLDGRVPFDLAINFPMCIFAVIMSALSGMIFGVIPAIKASKIDPIKAIQG